MKEKRHNRLRHPRVFVSYSHDSEQHADHVRQLAERLVRDGIQCVLDQWQTDLPQGWPQWMDQQLDEADYVLVVCTETYYRRATGKERPGVGLGVRFESVLIGQDLYDAGMLNEKFVPVAFDELPLGAIIRPLRAFSLRRVDTESGYEDLVRLLTGQPRHLPPKLGVPLRLPPESGSDVGIFPLHSEADGVEPSGADEMAGGIAYSSSVPTFVAKAFVHGGLTARGLLDLQPPQNPYRIAADPTDISSVGKPREIYAYLWLPHKDYMKNQDPFTTSVAICSVDPEGVVHDLKQNRGLRLFSLSKNAPSGLRNEEREILLDGLAEILQTCFVAAVTIPAPVLSAGQEKPLLAYQALMDLFLFPLLHMHRRLEFKRFHLRLRRGGGGKSGLLKIAKRVSKGVYPEESSSVELIEGSGEMAILVDMGRFLAWMIRRRFVEGKNDWLDRLKDAL